MAKNGASKTPKTINGATGEVEPPPHKKRDRTKLDTSEDVLNEMRRLYRRAKLEGKDVGSLVWILGEIRRTMELTTLSDQVEKLKAMYLRYGAPELAAPGPAIPAAQPMTSGSVQPESPGQ